MSNVLNSSLNPKHFGGISNTEMRTPPPQLWVTSRSFFQISLVWLKLQQTCHFKETAFFARQYTIRVCFSPGKPKTNKETHKIKLLFSVNSKNKSVYPYVIDIDNQKFIVDVSFQRNCQSSETYENLEIRKQRTCQQYYQGVKKNIGDLKQKHDGDGDGDGNEGEAKQNI